MCRRDDFRRRRWAVSSRCSSIASYLNRSATLTTILVDGAIDRLRQGDEDTHNQLVAERAPELEGMDAIMLAHFSTSLAADAVRARTAPPVLTAPQAAVLEMKRLVLERSG